LNGSESEIGTVGPGARSVSEDVEVAVVGAGLAGLAIATLLAAYGDGLSVGA
jgi:cation diffusion facilitator CzcD-associated flavoprotein CzcO